MSMHEPTPTPLPPPISIIPPPFDEDDTLTEEEINELEERLYYEAHDDRAYWI